MAPRIAITGAPGVGKSTVCRKIIEMSGFKAGGMLSSDLRVSGVRVGFELRDIAAGRVGILAHVKGTGPTLGKYHVNLEDLNSIGVNAIRNAITTGFVVIDEVGPMELKSREFIHAVENAVNSRAGMLVVLHQKSQHPIVERIRKEFEVFTVTLENRDLLAKKIAEKLKAWYAAKGAEIS